jgi:hypothetical protein
LGLDIFLALCLLTVHLGLTMPKHSQMLLALTALVCASLSHAQITGYSNTLSTYAGSATGVTSTYSFVPPSGLANAWRTIKITNQGFSAASSPLTAACTNILSFPTTAISTAAAKDQTLSVSFKISSPFTAHASDNKITLTFPAGLVTTQAINLCGITSPASVVSTSAYTTNKITLTVTSDLAAGSVTVTCTGLTLATLAAETATVAGLTGLKIETWLDTLSARISTPNVGAVTASLDALQMVKAVGAGGNAAVTFKISTPFAAHASNNKITLTFPAGLVTAQAINLCGITSPASVVSTSAYTTDTITLTVTSDLAAGSVTVTCSGLTIAAKPAVTATATGTMGLKIQTSLDSIAAYVSTPAVGAVVATSFQSGSAAGSGKSVTVSFTTSTTLVESSSNKITLTFPPGFISANPDNECAISGVVTTSKFASNTITLDLAPYSRLSAGPVTVTCSKVTLSARAAATGTNGLNIQTSADTIPSFISTPMIGGVTAELNALKMDIGTGADKTATVTFKTSTAFAASATNNKITLTFPIGLVSQSAINLCAITVPASVVSTSAYAFNAITLTVTSVLDAGSVTVTCSGLTLAAMAAVTATATGTTGLKIETSLSTELFAYASTPCVGCVTAVAASALTMGVVPGTKPLSLTFTTVSALTTTAVGVLPAINGVITLNFPIGLLSANLAQACDVSSPAPSAPSVLGGTIPDITITLAAGATVAAGTVTITCTGLTINPYMAVTATPAIGQNPATGLKVHTSVDTIGAYVNTPCVGCVTAAASALTMGVVPGTGKTLSLTFTTVSVIPATTGVITLNFPTGLVTAGVCEVVPTPTTLSTSAITAPPQITITLAVALAAGSVTVTCTGLTLGVKEAVAAKPPSVQTQTPGEGLAIRTSVDLVDAWVSTPCVGCVSAGASALTMGVVPGTGKPLSLTFTTVSVLPHTTGKITLEFPTNLVGASLVAPLCEVSSPARSGSGLVVALPLYTITLGAGADIAAGTVTVTCSGVTLGPLLAVTGTPAIGQNPSAGLKVHTSVDTHAAYVSTPCVGCVTIDFSGSSTFSATLSEAKTLDITSAVNVWTASASSAVTCTVGSFTNAPFTSAQRRSLLQSTEVQITTADADGNPLTPWTSTGQTFPLSVVVAPSRTLYLPKASGAAFGVAWMCVLVSALLFWL